MTIFIIKKLLCLVHYVCLWLEEPIPIIDHLIHQITWLPCTGEDPPKISKGKGDDLALAEGMKNKFESKRKKRVYVISSIKNPVVKVAT